MVCTMNNNQQKEKSKAIEDTVSELVVSLGLCAGTGGLPLVICRTTAKHKWRIGKKKSA